MRPIALALLTTAGAVGLLWLMSPGDVSALPAGGGMVTVSGGITCPPLNLPAAPVTVGGGFSAIDCEVEGTTAVYFCGSNALDGGVLGTAAAASCHTRCSDTTNCKLGGGIYTVDVVQGRGNLTCWSAGTSDAGVKAKCAGVR